MQTIQAWMLLMSAKQKIPMPIGTTANTGRATWVQTERKAHEAWANLIARKPSAAALMHHLVARMERQNAVVVAQKTLARLMGVSVDTVKRAVKDLEAERWIQVVKLGPGTACAYVINDRVAWGQSRGQLHLSTFSATVVADAADQDPLTLEHQDLRRIPVLFAGEQQLPTGPGEDPPTQPSIPGMEPDLPALTDSQQLEERGQMRLMD